jgi:hypothetical protein
MLFNAELALMFIPVPIKAKYSSLVLVDLYLESQDNLFLVGGIAHFTHVGGALWLSNYVVEEESV